MSITQLMINSSIKRTLWDGTANYLILAGGGGGGGVIDGGGGAGGYRTSWGTGADGTSGNSGGLSSLETALTLSAGTAYTITVGQGGEGGLGFNSGIDHRGHKGRDSSISGSDITTVTSDGGGGGSALNATSTEIDGGSGGGGSNTTGGGSATLNQGFDGGTSATNGNVSGGGGGAGAVGATGTTTTSGDGGDGLASTITGTSITRAGGGGGGIRATTGSTHGIGGAGGGGDGGVQGSNSHPALPYGTVTTTSATHGRAQYGGGGGGAGYNTTGSSTNTGGNGGSGTVILRLPELAGYSAAQLTSDVSSPSNCTTSYLNTQVYTDDTNFNGVTLLMDGTSATEDLSNENQSSLITNNGSVTTTSLTGPSGYGTVTALDLNGSTQYLSTTYYTSGLYNQDFTIEGWFYVDNPSTGVIQVFFSHRTGTGNFDSVIPYINTTSNYGLVVGNGSSWQINTTGGSVTTGWHHIAVTRNGNDYVLWVDGASTLTGTYSGTVSASGNFAIGAGSGPTGSQHLDCKVFDFRVTEGVARYTSAFTAPTSALSADVSGITSSDDVVLLLDGTSTTDQSSANTGLTNNGVAVNQNSQSHPYASGALLFDGTDDLTITTENDNLYLGTDDWTIEGWFRTTNLSTTNTILEYRTSGSDNGAGKMFIGVLSNGQVGIYENTVYQAQSATGAIVTNTWYHLAFVRNGGTVSVFIDGSLADSGSLSSPTVDILRPTSRPIIGGFTGGGFNWIGEWADFRITKGAALYPFHPPISAFPNRETSTGGDHVITFTVATEDPYDGVTANDGTITWRPFAPPPPFTHIGTMYERTTTSTSTQTFTPPTGAQAGDLLVLSCFQDQAGGNVATGPSGWSTAGNLTAHPGVGQYYQIYNGTDTSWTVTWTDSKPTMGTVAAFRPSASISTASTEQFQATAGNNETIVDTISSVATTNAPGRRIYFYASTGITNGSNLHAVSTVFNPSTDWTTVSGQGAVTNDGSNYAYRLAYEGDAFESTTASGTCSDRFAQAFFIINTS